MSDGVCPGYFTIRAGVADAKSFSEHSDGRETNFTSLLPLNPGPFFTGLLHTLHCVTIGD